MLQRSSVQLRLREVLTAAANRGGWPYYAGKSSRIEPTCWALLALGDSWDADAAAWQVFAAPHLQWLSATQTRDGLLVDNFTAPPNFTANGLAACVLAHLDTRLNRLRQGSGAQEPRAPSGMAREPLGGRTSPDPTRLLDALIAVKGVSVDAPDPRQDNTLQGWPWMPDTFSWIEPTAWCLLALKKAGARARGAQARIDEAEKLIVNRTCEPGGWNFGNASVVGQDLRPYVPTTAIALIALQDRRQAPAVSRSIAWLTDARLKEPSAPALALASVALRIYGVAADDVDARLAEDVERAERVGNLQALAMALYALSAERHGGRALRV